jgi:hexosaminidase
VNVIPYPWDAPAPVGLVPDPMVADERYTIEFDGDHVRVTAPSPAGEARARATLTQVGAEVPRSGRIVDGPRYAWRGLSFDAARHIYPLDELRRVVDLLALYKLNVLHLHLTDDQSWIAYPADDLRSLVAYAAERFVTVVPEIDVPGHTTALIDRHPELRSDRNTVAIDLGGGHIHRAVWLDPDVPATFEVIEQVLTEVAGIFTAPWIHIGADEPFGMPGDLYTQFVRRARQIVRSIGRKPLGWQESARAGLSPDDVIQYWIAGIDLPEALPAEFREPLDSARSALDLEAAAEAGAGVILSPASHCYLDVPYADPPGDPTQADRHHRLGMRFYKHRTIEESFDWDPAGAAGVEAAIWAESIEDFDDLMFLLLPRLPGVAQKAWGDPGVSWADHRDRLAGHRRLWEERGLAYFANTGAERNGTPSIN